MHSKRGTLDYLQKFEISDTNICIMCKQIKETNRHALCFCTHPIIVEQRHRSAVAIKLSTRKYGGTPTMQNIMYTLCKPGKTSTTNNMRIEEYQRETTPKYIAQKNRPKHKERNESNNRTYSEEIQARAVEIIVNARGITPLWIGIITNTWMWPMEWGGIPGYYISDHIREIRGIIYAFARESWKMRCTKVYSPEEEQKRKIQMDMNKIYASYMKQMKSNINMNITDGIHMTMQEKKLLQRMEHRNQWKQVCLKALEFFTESEINNNTEPVMTTKYKTMKTVQKEADKRVRKIQLNFTLMTTIKGKQPTKNKRKQKQNNPHNLKDCTFGYQKTANADPVTRKGK